MKNINAIFYDIESLYNVFTLSMFTDNKDLKKQILDVYYLSDDSKLTIDKSNEKMVIKTIKNANKNFDGIINFYNMKDKNGNLDRNVIFNLAKTFGVTTAKYINNHNPKEKSIYNIRYRKLNSKTNKFELIRDKNNEIDHKTYDPFRIVCDTDEEWIKTPNSKKYPYFFGYNSYNYDLSMLAYFFSVVLSAAELNKEVTDPTDDIYGDIDLQNITANKLRLFNNTLFEDQYKNGMPEALKIDGGYNATANLIRKNMLMSGRHLDVARLNEKQSKVALKRLLGMLGYQILESDKVGQTTDIIKNMDEFADLLAYNASDVFNLKMLFYHPQYQGQFELKQELLKTYPQVMYYNKDIKVDENYTPTLNTPRKDYEAYINPENVRIDRLTIDSSSAQFSTKALCPYDTLKGENVDTSHRFHPKDDKVVSFLYPDKREVEEQQALFDAGDKSIIVPVQKDILEEAKSFFDTKFKDFPILRAKFDLIYKYYDWIRGKNFNNSASYGQDYLNVPFPNYNAENKAESYKDSCIEFFTNQNEPEFLSKIESIEKDLEKEYNRKHSGSKLTKEYKEARKKHVLNKKLNRLQTIITKYEEKYATYDLNQLSVEAPKFIGEAFDEVNDPEHKNGPIATVKFNEQGTCLPYFNKNGEETSCFVLFSTGGIHGAEYNVELFNHDLATWQQQVNDLNEVKHMFNDDAVAARKERKYTLSDGREIKYTDVLKNGLKIDDSEWKDLESKRPKLFTEDKKGYSLNKKYNYTSAGFANHEDFSSYYPNLLRKMWTFYNEGLNYDRYEEIFNQKSEYGKLMKDKSLSSDERSHYRIMREGTKLILNSASGAANARFDNNIRNDNQIIAMRCIGQLFSWMIGQAAAYEGALIPSTNTDGLYTFMDEDLNKQILEKESANTGVEIEAEPIYLISKDANNRIEYTTADKPKVLAANGGTVGCYNGPNPSKNLAHPAVIDWAMTEYLILAAKNENGASLDKPFNRDLGLKIMLRAAGLHDTLKSPFGDVLKLMMFQNIIASSTGSHTYIYGINEKTDKPKALQHINRMFIMKKPSTKTYNLQAAVARKVTPAMKNTRAKNNERAFVTESVAEDILKANGEDILKLNSTRDIVTKKCTGIEPKWHILIENNDLYYIVANEPKKFEHIINNLDLEKYVDMLESSFMNNWKNNSVNEINLQTNEDTNGKSGEEN